jgi:iron complex transport system substrate-binding protein
MSENLSGEQSRKVFFIIPVFILILLFTGAGCLSAASGPLPVASTNGPGNQTDTPITLTDSLGNTVTLPHPAQRIICQNGMAAEILVAMGSGDRIVGVTDALMSERYVIEKIPDAESIGVWDSPDIERILTLRPDVMLVYSSKTKNIDTIRAANITVIYIDCNRLPTVPSEARKLGILTGNTDGAERFAKYIEGYLDLVVTRLSNLTESEMPRVYSEMYADYMAQGPGSTGNSVLEIVKARNIAQNISTSTAIVNPDWIIQQDPEVIIKYVTRTDNLTLRYEQVRNRPLFEGVTAVRENRVYAIKGDVISGPRGIAGILYIAKVLYPDRFSDIDPNQILHEYAQDFVPGSDDVDTYLP